MSKEDFSGYIIKKEDLGRVVIAEEVVAKIAGMAALEVDGVQAMAGNATTDVIAYFSGTNLARGVKIEINGTDVNVSLVLILTYDCSIPKTCKAVQEKVKSSVENMTGLNVCGVNIKVAGVSQSKGL